MATHEDTPLLTIVQRGDAARALRRRSLAAFGVFATLGFAACVGVAALRSGAGPASLGDALDDALANLRGLDALDDGKAVDEAEAFDATATASEGFSWPAKPDMSAAAATTDEESATEVMNHVYDPLVLGPDGAPANPSETDMDGPESLPEVIHDADDTLAMPAPTAVDDAGDFAWGKPEASGSEVPDASEQDATDASAPAADLDPVDTADADATVPKKDDDAVADAPKPAGWGDDWLDLDIDLERIKALAEKLGPKNKTLVADYPPVPPHPDLPKQLSPDAIIVTKDQSGLPFEFTPRFLGTLPEPETAANEVVAVAVANVPGVGFTDEQIELVRANKERNAGLPAGSLSTRAMFYAITDSFDLTNCACGGDSLNEYILQPTLNESFTLAAPSMSQPVTGVQMNHCDQKDVPEGTYANFNSMATLHYTVMVDREAIGDEAALNTFMRESLAIVHTPDFYTLLQAGILESGASPDHEGSKIVENGFEQKLFAFIVLEGPPGTAQAVERTNGPVMATTA